MASDSEGDMEGHSHVKTVHDPEEPTSKGKKRKRGQKSEEEIQKLDFKRRLGLCCKDQDGDGALRVYEEATRKGVSLDADSYNTLLAACAASSRPEVLELFNTMKAQGMKLREASYTSVIRLLACSGKPEEACALIDEMKAASLRPRLRTYTPVLTAFCAQNKSEESFAVYRRILDDGLEVTEAEYISLLQLCVATSDHQGFERVLEDMKEDVLEPSEEGLSHLLAYFEKQGPEAYLIHPQVSVSVEEGRCSGCGEVLQSIDITPEGSQALMSKITELVLENSKRAEQWERLTTWASKKDRAHDVVIDGANVGYFEMNYLENMQHINYEQVDWVVDHFLSLGKKVVLVLHARHVFGSHLPEEGKALVEKWREAKILQYVPGGHNDDWHWLYLTVCQPGPTLLVTNDEMRDHHFQMLSQRSFLRWRERHQAYFSFGARDKSGRRQVIIDSPPVFSRCMQKLPSGTWHFPRPGGNQEFACVQPKITTAQTPSIQPKES